MYLLTYIMEFVESLFLDYIEPNANRSDITAASSIMNECLNREKCNVSINKFIYQMGSKGD